MKEIGSSPYLFNNIFNVTLGLVAGYLSKRALYDLAGQTINPGNFWA
jgi:hypothetical protein